MLKHIVFFRFKPEVTEEQIVEIEQGLGALPSLICEIKGFEFGRDIVRSERSYDLALVSDFEDLDAMNRYQVHPEHQKVVAKVKAAAESVVAVDYEY